MKELVCQNNSTGTSLFLWWQTVWENYRTGLTTPDSVSEKITPEEQSPLKRRQVVWRNFSEQLTKKIVLKLAPIPQKEKNLPFMEIVVPFDRKKKSCPYKAGMKRLKLYKSSNLLLWKFTLYKPSSKAATRFLQLPTYPTVGDFSQQYLPTIRFQYSTFVEIE